MMHAMARHDTLAYVTESEGVRLLGQAIRARRDRLGLTAEQVAERIGVATGTIYFIEHGRAPRRGNRARLETVLLWAPGSCDKVLAGGKPDELPVPTAAAIDVSPQERVWLDEVRRIGDPDARRRAIRVAIAAARAELDDL